MAATGAFCGKVQEFIKFDNANGRIVLTNGVARAVRLSLATVDAEIDRTGKGALPQETGVGVNDLHHLGVIFRQPEAIRRVLLYQRSGWI